METILNNITLDFITHVTTTYLVSVIVLTFIVLSYVIKKPTASIKILVHLISGLILGIVWYYVNKVSVQDIIVTFLLSVVLYAWVIKQLLSKFGSGYDNGIGIDNNTK